MSRVGDQGDGFGWISGVEKNINTEMAKRLKDIIEKN